MRWLVLWPLIGELLNLVQWGWAWAGCDPAQSPSRCTKCNNPPINGQCTNFTRHSNYLWLIHWVRKCCVIVASVSGWSCCCFCRKLLFGVATWEVSVAVVVAYGIGDAAARPRRTRAPRAGHGGRRARTQCRCRLTPLGLHWTPSGDQLPHCDRPAVVVDKTLLVLRSN